MEIILVRHGQTEHNRNKVFHGWIDSELDDTGILQAKRISKMLSEEKIDVIFASPLKRTVETANIIAKQYDSMAVDLIDDIKEVNFGLFEGLSYQEICEKHNDEAKKWEEQALEYHFPEGEGISEFFERIRNYINDLIQRDYKRVLLVTHEGCIRCILSYVSCNSIDMFWKYTVKTGSVSRVIADKNFSYILSLNENYSDPLI